MLSLTAKDNGTPPLSRQTQIHVNLVDDKYRFIIILTAIEPSGVVPYTETLRQTIQVSTGEIATYSDILNLNRC